jgi:tRNA(Met) C34 N-acetyltransferase TmcA
LDVEASDTIGDMPRVLMPPWTPRTRAKNDLENYCLMITCTVQWVKVRGKLYDGDEQGRVLEAVKQLRDWLDKNQHAEKDEFEARHNHIRRVVNRVMNDARNREYEAEMKEEERQEEEKKKEEERKQEERKQEMLKQEMLKQEMLKGLLKQKPKLRVAGCSKPPLPLGPPPPHLMAAAGYGKSSSSGSAAIAGSPYLR